MVFRKLRILGRGRNECASIGVTLPKGYLQYDDLVDPDGEPKDTPIDVTRIGPGDYRVRAIENPDATELDDQLADLPTSGGTSE